MDLASRLAISYYETVATINDEHKVYLVRHRESGKICVKKILDVYNPQIYEYLQNHQITGVPALYEACEENGRLTVIEELISGISLQEMIGSRTLSVDLIIKIMLDLCDILGRLHCVIPPIIHRDIKPSNVIISSYGQAVLIDFNAAKYMSGNSNSDTVLLGTQGYAAPEQYGFGASTPQTDIYALGVLLKELSEPLTNIFDDIVNRCTQLNPADRPENVGILRKEFERLSKSAEAPAQVLKADGNKEHAPKNPGFALPGFRTKTPWKMIIAALSYACIFGFCLTLRIENVSVYMRQTARLGILSIMLSVVFCWLNYRNIQGFMPLCESPRRAVRCFGIFILNVRLVCLIFLAMWAAFALARLLP